ncbi:hemagglutinin repeat-containing protein [Xanthomonas campestris]|nr:hemagglutinin repeat-containing protein [Xanthomonas campestris]MEA9474632.1 hemagglutinin repeat-containing protein [Xanthomonas campestris]
MININRRPLVLAGIELWGVDTNISTGDSLQLTAGNDLTIRQAEVKAGGDLIAAAGNNLNVESVLN